MTTGVVLIIVRLPVRCPGALNRHGKAAEAYHRALQATNRHVEFNPDDARAYTIGAVARCRLGDRTGGLDWAKRTLSIDAEDGGIYYNVACLYALEGETKEAIDCLQRAVRAGFAHRDWVDPDLDSIRGDPAFQALQWRQR